MIIGDINFAQTALVVPCLKLAIESLDDAVGRGDWVVYDLPAEAFSERTYRGAEGSFSLRNALSWRGSVQWELIEPMDGFSVWHEHVEAQLRGIHHVGAYVDDIEVASQQLLRKGWHVVQVGQGFGALGDGEFRYFEHASMGFLAELIVAPKVRRPPLEELLSNR